MVFCLCCSFWEWVGVVTDAIYVSLNCEPTVIGTLTKVISLSFTVSRSMYHGLSHGFWWQIAQTADIALISGISTCHGPQHGFQWQYRPQISTWLSAEAWAMDTITATEVKDINMTSRQHEPRTLTWSLATAHGSSTTQGPQPGKHSF